MIKGATIQLLGGWVGVFELDKLFISLPVCNRPTSFHILPKAKYLFHFLSLSLSFDVGG